MKTKIGTVLEDDVIQKLRERAHKERKAISEIIQEAIITYMQAGSSRTQELRLASLKRLCSAPFHLSSSGWKEIMEEDYYEQ
jgi:hypothetical protein